jgi:hypothetical protein
MANSDHASARKFSAIAEETTDWRRRAAEAGYGQRRLKRLENDSYEEDVDTTERKLNGFE